jgi:hypothetical protein
MSFSEDIKKFSIKSTDHVDRVRKGVTFKLFAAVIKTSPVGNWRHWNISPAQKEAVRKSGYVGGRLRANWVISLNTTKDDESQLPNSNIGALNARLLQVIRSGGHSDTFILSNSLPYASRIEYDGWSGKAPEGMVRINVARFRELMKEQLQEVKS